MPPAAAFLTGEQVTLRAELGLLTEPEADERAAARRGGATDGWPCWPARGCWPGRGRRRRRRSSPSPCTGSWRGRPAMLIGVSLAEAVGERRPQNMPGTVDEYPNWRIPLAGADGRPVLLEDLPAHAGIRAVVRAVSGGPGRSAQAGGGRPGHRAGAAGDKVHAWLPAMNWTSCRPANCTTSPCGGHCITLDVEFLWELLRAIPAAEASEGHDEEAGRDISKVTALLADAIDSGKGDVAEALRPAVPRLPGQARRRASERAGRIRSAKIKCGRGRGPARGGCPGPCARRHLSGLLALAEDGLDLQVDRDLVAEDHAVAGARDRRRCS